MNTEMMTIRQAAQTLRVREEEMPALLGQSGMQTEDGLLTRENTELLREYLADIQRRGQKNLEQQTARCTFLVDTSAMVHRQFPEFMERLKPLDEVSYVRFASVYRQFKDINTFMQELNKILEEK